MSLTDLLVPTVKVVDVPVVQVWLYDPLIEPVGVFPEAPNAPPIVNPFDSDDDVHFAIDVVVVVDPLFACGEASLIRVLLPFKESLNSAKNFIEKYQTA